MNELVVQGTSEIRTYDSRLTPMLLQLIDDDVPKQWLPPYEGHSAPHQPPRPPSSGISRTSSRSSTQGLSQALATSRFSIDTRCDD